MKRSLSLSSSDIQYYVNELIAYHQQLSPLNFTLGKNDLLCEQDVAQLLGVSVRTMHTYRQRHYFHFIKLEGRIFYLRIVLYLDLLALSEQCFLEKEAG